MDSLLEVSPVAPCSTYRKGEPRSDRPNSKISTTSGVNLLVSDAEFEEVERQISDAREFFQVHAVALKTMRKVEGVVRVGLDFGIDKRDVLVQVDSFPPDLLSLLVEIDCSLVLTQFPVSRRSRNRRRYRESSRRSI